MDFYHFLTFLAGAGALYAYTRLRNRRTNAAELPHSSATGTDTDQQAPEIYAIAAALQDLYEQQPPPAELRKQLQFGRGVEHLKSTATGPELLAFARGNNAIVRCMALEALNRRPDSSIVGELLENLGDFVVIQMEFALRALNACAGKQGVCGRVLLALSGLAHDSSELRLIRDFIAMRHKGGEKPGFDDINRDLDADTLEELESLLNELGGELQAVLLPELRKRPRTVDTAFLEEIGRLTGTAEESEKGVIVQHKRLKEHVADLKMQLSKEQPRSVVIVGEEGVGKANVVKLLARRLVEEEWVVFEAGAVELMAGQKYFGMFEDRIKKLLQCIGGRRRVLWIVPNIHELLLAGRHEFQQTGVLDTILPYAERGEIRLLGMTAPTSFERLLEAKPQVRTALHVHRMEPAGKEETLEIVKGWTRHHSQKADKEIISEKTVGEAFELVRQFLSKPLPPGNMLRFLNLTRKRLAARHGDKPFRISLDDLIQTLSQLTGLPTNILDDRAELNLDGLREFFNERVFGQPEAVDCLIDRVAMIKAGLTDPTRPLGVFLFVGPTGTGKTEIAKTLAEYLFGSKDRMIRLDMSEFAAPESIARILGEGGLAQSNALVNQVRKQPFSVVLLDEFEKASPHVWDLFLQVFDDGRLSDGRGNVADFRHSIIIMTSNLGAAIPRGTKIGFLPDAKSSAEFDSKSVESAVNQAFRREFVNRLDRIVVFNPLERGVMRDLLHKELKNVLKRRGLRNRTWAVEWEESAINFLLEKGYTADLGARPLKRAIEHYVLSPLAKTIVNNQFPEGDQFLFVHGHGKGIEVEFIDPDDQKATGQEELFPPFEKDGVGASVPTSLKQIVADAEGSPQEFDLLQDRVRALDEHVSSAGWEQRKQAALEQSSSPEFWESAERFVKLALVEYMGRVEEGMNTARSLLERLAKTGELSHYSAKLMQRLAQQVYLLEEAVAGIEANQPRDAFLAIEAVRDAEAGNGNNEFAMRLGKMYWSWAQKRKMHFEILEEFEPEKNGSYRLIVSVSGFGAYSLLEPEVGMHVYESPGHGKSMNRNVARVRVVAQPESFTESGRDALIAKARELVTLPDENTPAIIRRYRKDPSPLVRDAVRKWRSGRLDRVLAGDFDIME